MISNDKDTEIFCTGDDFCKEMTQILNKNSIESNHSIKRCIKK